MEEIVSVIIPIYNQELYLKKSLESILNQTYKSLEIICVNDGSTDKSDEIINYYMNKDRRIVCINKKNGGLVDALIVGIKNAKGKYICFLDSDDYVGNKFVETFISNIENYDFIAASHYLKKDEQIFINSLSENKVYKKNDFETLKYNLIFDEIKHQLACNILNSRWNKMYKTDLLKSMIKDYEKCKGISFGEDTLFTYILLNYAQNGKAINKNCEYYYNIGNQNSMMTNESINAHIKKSKEAYLMFNELIQINKEENYYQSIVMYYYLIEPLFQRMEYSTNVKQFKILYKYLKSDKIYNKALQYLCNKTNGKRKIVFWARKNIKCAYIYKLMLRIKNFL